MNEDSFSQFDTKKSTAALKSQSQAVEFMCTGKGKDPRNSMSTKAGMLHPEDVTNFTIRTSVLVLLCCQNAGHALLARYSQGVLKERYSSTEVVLVGEVLKFFISGYLALKDPTESDSQGQGLGKLVWCIANASKIIVLVILYSMSNILSYYALARVEAAAYTVMLQLKIFSTAAFAVVLLNRNISSTKWRALILLVIGCVLVASPTFNRPIDCSEGYSSGSKFSVTNADNDGDDDEAVGTFDSIMGVSSVLLMVVISGYASIYFEGILKKTGEKLTIWERNFQLAFYSMFLLILVTAWETFMILDEDVTLSMLDFTPFKGWTINTVLIALIQAGGGLLVAATLKYADAVLKTLATSGSIVLSAVLGYFLLGGQLDIFVSMGCVATILAIFNYTLDSTPKTV